MVKKRNVCSVVLTSIDAEEIRDGFLKFDLEYMISSHCGESRLIKDSFDGDKYNFKSNAFFEFLKTNGIQYVDYYDLVGLTFEAELHVDSRYNKVLIPTKLIAPPLMMR